MFLSGLSLYRNPKGIRVAEWLVENKVDIDVAKENLHNKKGPSYVFATEQTFRILV